MTEQEANKQIAKKLAEARELIRECAQIADESGVDFHWSGPSYGMGGSYTAKQKPMDEEDWESSDVGWNSSSQGC